MGKVLMIQLVIVLAALAGWIQNIVKFTECDFEAPYKAEVIHGAGIIPPVGMIVGWMDFGK